MSRIERCFAELDRPALVTFITAGDPDLDTSLKVLKALPKAGADIVELGMPFTDPVADGPTIQLASERALAAGANMKQTLAMAQAFREESPDTPLVLMGYFNPLVAYGLDAFTRDAAAAGVDGLIIVDLPPEEAAELRGYTAERGIDLVRLVTPTTDEQRLPVLLNGAGGFLYYVSITGITGAKKASVSDIAPHVAAIKKAASMPVAIGFGIKTPEDAKAMGAISDAVVVGSAIVEKIAHDVKDGDISPVTDFVSELAAALKTS